MDETALLAAGRAGTELVGGRAELPAAVLRQLCRDHAGEIDPRGIRLRGVRITGVLDLSGFRLPFPLSFADCTFTDPLLLDGTELAALTITGSVLPGMLANGIRVRRDLDLSRCRIRGAHSTGASKRAAVWLCEAEIGGRLLCLDAEVDGDGERAIRAERMAVGAVQLSGTFTTRGEVSLRGAHIAGSLDLAGAHLVVGAGSALNLIDTEVGGSVYLVAFKGGGRPPVLRGRIEAHSARVHGRFRFRDATLTSLDDGPVLIGHRVLVRNEVSLEGDCVFDGGVSLPFADLGNVVVESGCRLSAPGAAALDLTSAELRAGLILKPGVAVAGSLLLTGARIARQLDLRETSWERAIERRAVRAAGAVIGGDACLQRLRTTDCGLGFRAAELGGALDAAGAQLHCPGGRTLILHQAVVHGSVRLVDGFRSEGYLALNRVTVEGRLDLRGGHFHCPAPSGYNPAGHAIGAIAAVAPGGMYLGWASVSPSIDLTGASTTVLADDPTNWPPSCSIAGFSYDRFAEPDEVQPRLAWDWRLRVAWLERQRGFDTGTYEQVARVLRQHGYGSEAERVLIAQRSRIARTVPEEPEPAWRRARRLAVRAFGGTLAYGYRPWRALWMLIALFLLVLLTGLLPPTAGTLRAADEQGDVYAPSGLLVPTATESPGLPFARRSPQPPVADACGDGQVRCFQPVFFAVDTVLPLVSLNQRATWYPDQDAPLGGFMAVWLDLAEILGWIFSSVFVLSFTRLVRSP